MLKVLGTLASAMVVTSLLLSWLEPTVPSASSRPSAEELASSSALAVHEPSVLERNRWRAIEIVPGPASSLTAARLSAIPDSTESHFVVDDHGRVAGLRRWRDQLAPSDAPHAVRIQVSRVDRDGPMTESQWLAVRSLVAALHEEIAPAADPLPVSIEDGWARQHGLAEGAVLHITPDNAGL
jgi:hypothetical protein